MPEQYAGKLWHRSVVGGPFLVARGDAPVLECEGAEADQTYFSIGALIGVAMIQLRGG